MSYLFEATGCAMLLAVFGICGGQNSALNRTVAGPTTITPEWAEFTAAEPLRGERKEQEVILKLAPPFVGDFDKRGVKTPDGSVVQPEVQLVDTEGKTYVLHYTGFNGEDYIRFTLDGQLGGKEFRAVRLRAAKEIRCKRIIWSCYNWEDLNLR